MYYFLLKSVLGSIVGSSFYNWWKDTRLGIWFQQKLDSALEKVQKRYDLQIFEKEEEWKKQYPNLALRMEEMENRLSMCDNEVEYMLLAIDKGDQRVAILEAALDNLIPERRQGAD
jgi:hypothetical protein|tara:strand:+ start:2578 stop:2925 length:348 start_codon:yes stop_codon:yes gene_type:complete